MIRGFFVGLFCLVGVVEGSPTSQPASQPNSQPASIPVVISAPAVVSIPFAVSSPIVLPPESIPVGIDWAPTLPALSPTAEPVFGATLSPRPSKHPIAAWALYGTAVGLRFFGRDLGKSVGATHVGLDEFDFEANEYTATPEAIDAYRRSLTRQTLVLESSLLAVTTARQLQTQRARTARLSALMWGVYGLNGLVCAYCGNEEAPDAFVRCDVSEIKGKLGLSVFAITVPRAVYLTILEKPWQKRRSRGALMFGARGDHKEEQ